MDICNKYLKSPENNEELNYCDFNNPFTRLSVTIKKALLPFFK